MSKRRHTCNAKPWPEDGSIVDAGDAISPVARAFLQTHTVKARSGDADYDGLALGRDARAIAVFPFDRERGTIEEDVERWFMLAFQLGVEQGRRLTESDPLMLACILDKDDIAMAIATKRANEKDGKG